MDGDWDDEPDADLQEVRQVAEDLVRRVFGHEVAGIGEAMD